LSQIDAVPQSRKYRITATYQTDQQCALDRCCVEVYAGAVMWRATFSLAVSAFIAFSTASADVMTTVPPSYFTISNLYNQEVYDQSNTKVGRITDVLIDRDGQARALIIGFGGFLGIGAEHAAVSFDTVKATTKDNTVHLSLLLPPAHVLAVSPAIMMTVARNSITVTDWYNQRVYDQSNTKLGRIADVLIDREGRVRTLVIGVGGFLGLGESDIAVSFDSVKATMKEGDKVHLTMNTTTNALKSAPRFAYNHSKPPRVQ
jgi:sporulation protein YlmC with PRC-barrel domain